MCVFVAKVKIEDIFVNEALAEMPWLARPNKRFAMFELTAPTLAVYSCRRADCS